MLRTALTPRYLGLLGLVLVVGVAFVLLGRWQLGVAQGTAHEEAVERARSAAPVVLTDVLAPHSSFPGEMSSRPVTVTGHYTGGQLRVPDRRLDGASGSWVLTPFVVDATDATLPVLRGFLPEGADAGEPPTGPLTLSGGLAPPESPSSVDTGPGEIGSVDTSVLVNTWDGDLYNAFLFLQAETPATGPQLTKVPTPLGPTGVTWRNAAYAVQWWVFALFALWLWWRMVREEHQRTGADHADGSGDNGVREHL
ncbi:SURF1 family protein [Phycicoccus sp. CSK15P-2]|uniref:SURF1 family protein n=1 Tax=Phycicoccus sp. CSK15P-2 TaxID=2807627 RepID=UPI00194F91CD|nr:SURF1 family protein [Phycicoccus sp. CSK15P-2]MBM6402793.1 SURF1 family protein [Phycicoccus sp. CSK15P-2]